MSTQENQDALLGYFNELLEGNSASLNNSDDIATKNNQVKDAVGVNTLGDITTNTSSSANTTTNTNINTNTKSDLTNDLNTKATTEPCNDGVKSTLSQPLEQELKSEQQESIKAANNGTAHQANDLDRLTKTLNDKQSELETNTSKNHLPPEEVANLNDSLKPQVSNPSPIKKALSTLPTTESSDIYEQHKHRLEKMLQSVSPSQVNPLQETTPAFENLKSEVLGEVKTETDLDSQELEYLAPPPLSSEWLENGRPNWAQDRFDILIIEVNGLRLAVPLIALGQIQELDDKLTPLFGQSDWFMGLQQTPMGQVKTIDTTKFVMPERYEEDNQYHYVISINGLSWGLAVDSIDQPISIDPEAIRWRSKRDSRPWMAGMVKDHMCVLIDIPKMGEILEKEDKNHSKTTGG